MAHTILIILSCLAYSVVMRKDNCLFEKWVKISDLYKYEPNHGIRGLVVVQSDQVIVWQSH
jgi:hypothetical protein